MSKCKFLEKEKYIRMAFFLIVHCLQVCLPK